MVFFSTSYGVVCSIHKKYYNIIYIKSDIVIKLLNMLSVVDTSKIYEYYARYILHMYCTRS